MPDLESQRAAARSEIRAFALQDGPVSLPQLQAALREIAGAGE